MTCSGFLLTVIRMTEVEMIDFEFLPAEIKRHIKETLEKEYEYRDDTVLGVYLPEGFQVVSSSLSHMLRLLSSS